MMCPACGGETWANRELCDHHAVIDVQECANNRIMCGFIHRKETLRRLSAEDREPLSELTE